jgi:hypothetical protein
MPLRDADLYPLSQSYAGVSVAVDEISNPDRAARYFGADLIGSGILPVNVIVSNFSEDRWTIKPADILLRKGDEVIDPLPIGMVTDLIKRGSGYNAETKEQIEKYIGNLMLRETAVYPRDTHQGIQFFPVLNQRERGEFFSSIPLFLEGWKLHVVAANLDTGERKAFGPFSIYQGIEVWRPYR